MWRKGAKKNFLVLHLWTKRTLDVQRSTYTVKKNRSLKNGKKVLDSYSKENGSRMRN